ncbi:MAG TPA: hypothetical protein VN828_06155, partial [Acidobacteriaceae bacterium]|nr:hypothetical protein [Acidobacteriaceae bacterium]
MSTSDQDHAAGFSEPMKTDLPAGLPDVAMLTRMANEFFRAQPDQASSVIAAPYTPDAQDLTPTFETRLPEFGMPLPSVPAIPSAGHMPLSPDTPAMTEVSPFMVGPAAAMALPVAGIPQNDPRTAAGFAASPFALPMPEFGASFPSFETGVPAIPALPPMFTENDARSVLTVPSAFYFLEHAGGLGGSEMAPKQASAPTDLSSRPELRRSAVEGPAVSAPSLSSPFSLPMPEFDQALFP